MGIYQSTYDIYSEEKYTESTEDKYIEVLKENKILKKENNLLIRENNLLIKENEIFKK